MLEKLWRIEHLRDAQDDQDVPDICSEIGIAISILRNFVNSQNVELATNILESAFNFLGHVWCTSADSVAANAHLITGMKSRPLPKIPQEIMESYEDCGFSQKGHSCFIRNK